MDTLKAILLDVDGTLIDSNGAHARAWEDALRNFGRRVPAHIIRPLIGMGGDRVLRRFDIDPDSDEGRSLSDDSTTIFQQRYLPDVKPFPAVRDLLERMCSDGLMLVAATSAGGDLLEGLLEVAGVRDLISAATTSSDVAASKPAPDIVYAAMDQCGCDASRILMLGDTPYDVQAAHAAGIPVVAVTCGGSSAEDLKGADAIYASPEDILNRYERTAFGLRTSRNVCT